MEIKTKLNIGDNFYVIYHGIKENKIKCDCCNGVGYIDILNFERKISCPKCYGDGYIREVENEKWRVDKNDEYGDFCYIPLSNIFIEIKAKRRGSKTFETPIIKYMTTLGGGSLFNEDDCFATLEEAEVECDKRNNQEIGENNERYCY